MSCVQRKAYYRADGTYVRAHKVCRKSKVRIGPLKRGSLTEFGYHLDLDQMDRQHALVGAMYEYGPLEVFHKVHALAVLQKNKQPGNARIAKGDAKWISENFL